MRKVTHIGHRESIVPPQMTIASSLEPFPHDLVPAFLQGGGEAGAAARAVDWARSPLGPAKEWPGSLKTTLRTLLHSLHPAFLVWGPELIHFYNDNLLPGLGDGRHPAAMGQRGAECWKEIWPIVGPRIDDAMSLGLPSRNVDQLVPLRRNGILEEVYWTYTCSPVFDESGAVGGVLVLSTETTVRVLSERRQRILQRPVEARAHATDARALVALAVQRLGEDACDLPFILAYQTDPATREPALVAHAGLQGNALSAADAAVRKGARALQCAGVLELDSGIAAGPWPEPVRRVFAEPMGSAARDRSGLFLAFGLGPRLSLDSLYRELLLQAAAGVRLALSGFLAAQQQAAADTERRNLLEQAPVATALLRGPDHVFDVANRLFCKLVGRDIVPGQTYLQVLPELAGTPVYAVLDQVFQTGVPFATNEYLVPMDKGSGVVEDGYYQFNIEPLRDAAGAVYGMMAIAVDITELVTARRTLEAAEVEREQLVRSLESANRRKDEFLAMLGHELRNPLAPIATAVHLMKVRGDRTREREIIERQVSHLSRLVDDLLDVSRIASGKVALRLEPVEAGEVLAKAIEMAGPLLDQRTHRLAVTVPSQGLTVNGDAVRLAQVFANLLTNAAKYTAPGGQLELTAAREGELIVVRLKDNGIGIAPGLLQSIFEMFVQGHRSFDRSGGGLGLGLSLAKSLVGMHGGTIEAVSAGEGHGSEFVVRLPFAGQPAVVVPPAPLVREREARALRRILAVDDNVDAVSLLADLLGADGHQVQIAADGVEALEMLGRFDAEVCVLDLGLPGMDGFELARRIRARKRDPSIRLIALTGYGQESDRRRSREAGFDLHLVKPASLEQLLAAVDGGASPDR